MCDADIRELMRRTVAARFAAVRFEPALRLLSHNERMHTALEGVIGAERLGLAPVTTPA